MSYGWIIFNVSTNNSALRYDECLYKEYITV